MRPALPVGVPSSAAAARWSVPEKGRVPWAAFRSTNRRQRQSVWGGKPEKRRRIERFANQSGEGPRVQPAVVERVGHFVPLDSRRLGNVAQEDALLVQRFDVVGHERRGHDYDLANSLPGERRDVVGRRGREPLHGSDLALVAQRPVLAGWQALGAAGHGGVALARVAVASAAEGG